VEGAVGQIVLTGAQVADNASLDPAIRITGDLTSLVISGSGIPTLVNDDIFVGGRIGLFTVRGGDLNGSVEAGSVGTMYLATLGGLMQPLVSHGNLDYLKVQGGPIDASIDVYHHIGRIEAYNGVNANGDITVGSGFPGSGLDSLRVTGNMRGDAHVTGNLSELAVSGSLLGSDVKVSGLLSAASIGVNLTDSDMQANVLSRVTVNGMVSSSGPLHLIRASTGRFDLTVQGIYYDINNAAGVWFGNVHAYVGP